MLRRTACFALVGLLSQGLSTFGELRPAAAQQSPPRSSPPASTVIYVKSIHCAHCGAKISRQLKTVPGVAGVQIDVKANLARVTQVGGKTPSPKQMWEAVERAGYAPVKMTCPNGSYIKKPSV